MGRKQFAMTDPRPESLSVFLTSAGRLCRSLRQVSTVTFYNVRHCGVVADDARNAANTRAAAASDTASSRQVEAAFTRGGALPQWARPLRAVPAKSATMPRYCDWHTRGAPAGPKPGVLVHRVIQANQSLGAGHHWPSLINFVPHYQRVTLHALKVERGGELSDRTQTVSIRFLNSEPGLDSGVYSGGGLANLLLEDVRVGDSVHITYSVEGSNPVFRDQYSDTAGWDRPEGTDLRVVEPDRPRDVPSTGRWSAPSRARRCHPRQRRPVA